MPFPITESIAESEGAAESRELQKSAFRQPPRYWMLLFLYCTFATVGAIAGPLLQRLYYMHGGTRKWLSSCLLSVGVFIMVPVLLVLYLKNVYGSKLSSKQIFMDPKLLFSSSLIGIIVGLNNYMYAAGLAYIPVSTSSLLFSTQLVFTAVFAFFIVKQTFIFYTLNSVVVMTFGTVVLAFHTSSDRPAGVTQEKYLLGFFFTLGGAALFGLSLPLMELAYNKSRKPLNYLMVLQFQFVMNLSATLFCAIGMLVSKDLKVISKEAREFGLGEGKYYLILVASAITWQLTFLGLVGVISCTSSLFAGILTSVVLPFSELAAIVTFHEKFTAEKGMSLTLCLWGFTSYFIGEYKRSRKSNPVAEVELSKEGTSGLENPDHDIQPHRDDLINPKTTMCHLP